MMTANAPMIGCKVQASSGSIPCDAKKGSQPDLVISPQVPLPMKQRATVTRKVQCNWACKVFLSPEFGLKRPRRKNSFAFINKTHDRFPRKGKTRRLMQIDLVLRIK